MRNTPYTTAPTLQSLAEKIFSGAKDFTPEELQLQANEGTELEKLLTALKVQGGTPAAAGEAPKETTPATQPVPKPPVTIPAWLAVVLLIAAVLITWFIMKNKIIPAP